MAAVKEAVKENVRTMYTIIARSPETMKEKYATVNVGGIKARMLPFDTPVPLSKKEVSALRRQRESIQIDAEVNVHQLMEKHKISQEKANRLAQQINSDRSMGGKKIDWVEKYIIVPA